MGGPSSAVAALLGWPRDGKGRPWSPQDHSARENRERRARRALSAMGCGLRKSRRSDDSYAIIDIATSGLIDGPDLSLDDVEKLVIGYRDGDPQS
jgi:hypothetical protein